MVVIVHFRRGKDSKVISTMILEGFQNCPQHPDIQSEHVTLHNHRAGYQRQQITNNMLDWMAILIGDGYWCRHLVMDLVNFLVEIFYVEESMGVVEENLPTHIADR